MVCWPFWDAHSIPTYRIYQLYDGCNTQTSTGKRIFVLSLLSGLKSSPCLLLCWCRIEQHLIHKLKLRKPLRARFSVDGQAGNLWDPVCKFNKPLRVGIEYHSGPCLRMQLTLCNLKLHNHTPGSASGRANSERNLRCYSHLMVTSADCDCSHQVIPTASLVLLVAMVSSYHSHVSVITCCQWQSKQALQWWLPMGRQRCL